MQFLIKLSYFMRSSHFWDIARPSFVAGCQPHIGAHLQLHRVGSQKSRVMFDAVLNYLYVYFNIYNCLHVIVGQGIAKHGFDENMRVDLRARGS